MSEIINKIKEDPYIKFLGIQFDVIEEGYSLCSVEIMENMINFAGLVHGGLIFTIADAAFSAASNCDYYPSYALDVSGSFFKTAELGDMVKAEARLIHTTKRTGMYRMDVNNNDTLIATFNGTVFRKV